MNRLRGEQEHFDAWVEGCTEEDALYGNLFTQRILEEIKGYSVSLMEDLEGKQILVYGAGVSLRTPREFAEKGAEVYLIDISKTSIEVLLGNIIRIGWEKKLYPMVMDCENLGFGECRFDYIYGKAILHHLNIEHALREIRRVLKPNGKGIFIEPMGMNPLIAIYRKLTPSRRTAYEKPLDGKDFQIIESCGFTNVEHKEFNLLTSIGVFYGSLGGRKNKILKYESMRAVDRFLLENLPYLRKYCWNTVISVSK